MNHFPLFAVMLRLKDSGRLPGQSRSLLLCLCLADFLRPQVDCNSNYAKRRQAILNFRTVDVDAQGVYRISSSRTILSVSQGSSLLSQSALLAYSLGNRTDPDVEQSAALPSSRLALLASLPYWSTTLRCVSCFLFVNFADRCEQEKRSVRFLACDCHISPFRISILTGRRLRSQAVVLCNRTAVENATMSPHSPNKPPKEQR